jgi:hypothetical protein
MKFVRSAATTLVLLSLYSVFAHAQSGFGTRPTLGIFGGVTLPSGDFGDEVGIGAHAGGLVSIRAYKQLDIRVDGAWNKFKSKDIVFSDATLETYATLIYGTLNGVLNLGPDSSSYPGDHSVSPYLLFGGGAYNLDYAEECTGNCGQFVQSEGKTFWGLSLGAGSNATFGPLHPFAEARWHRIQRGDKYGGTRSLFTFSAGLRFR